jgi:Flp pilus assembly protein TadD
MILRRILLLGLLLAGPPLAHAQSVPGCGTLQNAYGPFDYRDPVAKEKYLPVVDHYHFTADVQTLRRGISSANVLDDLNYTLRAFPNHHPALNSVAEYALQGGKFPRDNAIPSAECYFQRAIAWRSDDEMVRTVFANYLARSGRRKEARAQYEEALRLAPASPEIAYDAGLYFVGEGDIERAKRLADIAYAAGYPLPGLRNKIARAEAARR